MAEGVLAVRVVTASVKGVDQVTIPRIRFRGEDWVPRAAWEESGLFPASKQTLQGRLAANPVCRFGQCPSHSAAEGGRAAGGPARLEATFGSVSGLCEVGAARPARRARRWWSAVMRQSACVCFSSTRARCCRAGRCAWPAGPGAGRVGPGPGPNPKFSVPPRSPPPPDLCAGQGGRGAAAV